MKCEIVCIIDRSGSMNVLRSDAIGGFNTFIEEQRKIDGEATVTFVQFDDVIETIYTNKPLAEVPLLDKENYVPRAMTALHDAVGGTIDLVGGRLSSMKPEDRPDKVIVAILTDGIENASTKFSLADIREKVTRQRDVYKWEFIFLAANQDAFAEGAKLGIKEADRFTFAATSEGTAGAYRSMSSSVGGYRGS